MMRMASVNTQQVIIVDDTLSNGALSNVPSSNVERHPLSPDLAPPLTGEEVGVPVDNKQHQGDGADATHLDGENELASPEPTPTAACELKAGRALPWYTREHTSDQICTALQLTNHWQDVAGDILERDRIYIPSELIGDVPDFEQRLRTSAAQGYSVDGEFLEQSREVIQVCVNRTQVLFDNGRVLLDRLDPRSRPIIRLFWEGGSHVLDQIRNWNYETALHRPRLSRLMKLGLVVRAWGSARLARSGS